MTGLADHVKTANQAFLKHYSILLYSMPSAGKTTLAAQAPNCLILELDRNGWIVLNHPLVPKSTKFIALRDYNQVLKFVKALSTDPILKEIDTICVDTISELQSFSQFNELSGDYMTGKWNFNQHIYSVSNFRTIGMMNLILDLGKDVIFNCHMKKEKLGEGATAKTNILPDLSESLLADVMAMVDGAFFLVKDNDTRRLRLQTEPEVVTKSRFRKGTTILNPKFEDVLKVINELKEPKPND